MESLRIASICLSPRNTGKNSPKQIFSDKKATHNLIEEKIVKSRLAVPAKNEIKKPRDKNNSCVPVARSTVFPYYITSQSGSNRVNIPQEEQGQKPRIGILKKQKKYRNLFVLLEPSYKQQSL